MNTLSYGEAIKTIKHHREEISQLRAEISKLRGWVKPGHGPCCTCQTCGHNHDDCRCDLDDVGEENERLRDLLIEARDAMKSNPTALYHHLVQRIDETVGEEE